MKKITCDYCGGKFNGEAVRCPHCGGPNRLAEQYRTEAARPAAPAEDQTPSERRGVKKPATIQELRDFAAAHNLPLDKMRVHLGEDYPGMKAFGIFQAEDGSFVVYKNKADGSRAIRYQGPDEAHAVNELYLKMKEQVRQQRSYQNALNAQTRSGNARAGKGLPKNLWKYAVVALAVLACWLLLKRREPNRGYYRYQDDYYYYQRGDWYVYNNNDWLPVIVNDSLAEHSDDYYASSFYSDDYDVADFEDSDYYNPGSYNGGNEDNWDDDDDWDWDDDWDDIGDWDSDW